ncbi:BTAD domain-containing putative transcriptional regulator [Nonomuraea sp. NPDC049028]|uniref:BTAD domain-containing putative transcriptional regulator n=1 Tax=Nonomuraea sp. NPDC049028 TaxID=3364348 RepID=UPI0037233179
MVRIPRGYQLGLPAGQVDALMLGALVEQARAALREDDVALARRRAEEGMALVAGGSDGATGALAELRSMAAKWVAEARRVAAIARGRSGAHEGALPLLEEAAADRPHDEELLACLLRSEAAVRGAAAALERYERYRAGEVIGPFGVAAVEVERQLFVVLLFFAVLVLFGGGIGDGCLVGHISGLLSGAGANGARPLRALRYCAYGLNITRRTALPPRAVT